MHHRNVLSLIGHTPLVALTRMNPNPGVTVLVKVESKSIGGSIKDRVALAMIEAAEASGELTSDKTVIEATSGNTGIGLAMVCAVKGYRIKLIMSEAASEERKRILRALGAEIQLTPGRLSTDGAIEEAYRLAREEPDRYVLVDQYNNPACVEAHYHGTAREIWDDTEGRVTHVVSTLGTTGTAMGLARGLKERGDVKVVAVEPYAGHKIQGLKNMQESYPPGIYDKRELDAVQHVEDEEAFETARRLAREEGLLMGMSSGAAVAAALEIARGLEQGVVVAICPDSGERYLSTTLFEPRAEQGVRLMDLATAAERNLSVPSEGLGLFTLGPGLDNPGADLGAWRRILLLDVLARHQKSQGGAARVAVSLADLDDRALAAGRETGLRREEFTRQSLGELGRIAGSFGVDRAISFVTAGESLERALNIVRKLMAKGLAYEKLRSVYFDVLRDRDYGRIARQDLEALSLGKTVDLEAYVKENPRDFTLLKRVTLQDLKTGDMVETEWGNVRPSWFLQHAAAALEGLGSPDVVLVPEGCRFPHMDNFRGIWSLGAGISPQAWLACQPVSGEAGESGTTEALPDVEAAARLAGGYASLRLFLLSTSYHKPLSITGRSLAMWSRNWQRVQDLYASLVVRENAEGAVGPDVEQALYDLRNGLHQALEADLSLHRFWPELFRFVKAVNARLGKGDLSGAEGKACAEGLREMDRVLAVLDASRVPVPRQQWPADAVELMARREKARMERDFSAADALREELARAGFRVEDTAEGSRLFAV